MLQHPTWAQSAQLVNDADCIQQRSSQRQVAMGELTVARRVIGRDVAVAPKAVAIGDQPLQSHRTARRQGLGADTHLGAEAVAEAIGESGGAVVIDPGTVHRSQKAVGGCTVLREDHLGVAGAVTADVVHGLVEVVDHLHRQDQIEIFRAPVLVSLASSPTPSATLAASPRSHTGIGKGRDGSGQKRRRDRFVHQQGFNRIAGGRVLGLAVDRHTHSLGPIRCLHRRRDGRRHRRDPAPESGCCPG